MSDKMSNERRKAAKQKRAAKRTEPMSDSKESAQLLRTIQSQLSDLKHSSVKGAEKSLKQQVDRVHREVNAIGHSPFAASGPFSSVPFSSSGPFQAQDLLPNLYSEILAGKRLHPKRFGGSYITAVRAVQFSQIVALTGTSFASGDSVSLVSIPRLGHLGMFVLARTPGTGSFKLIAVVSPVFDVSDFSDQSACLFFKGSISAPQVVGGSVQVLAVAQVEDGMCSFPPCYVRAGKLAQVCTTGQANAIRTMSGDEGVEFQYFTTDVLESELVVQSTPDLVASDLVENFTVGGIQSSALPSMANPFTIRGNASSASAASATGFVSNMATSFALAPNVDTRIWQLFVTEAYTRAIYFGNFTLEFTFPSFGPVNVTYSHQIVVTFSDNTTYEIRLARVVVGTGMSAGENFINTRVDTRTMLDYPDNKLIKDISYFIGAGPVGVTVNPTNNASHAPRMIGVFHEMSANERYYGVTMTGLSTISQLAINGEAHVEYRPLRHTAQGRLFDATPDGKASADMLQPYLDQVHAEAAASGVNVFNAKGFLGSLKKAGRALLRAAPGAISAGLVGGPGAAARSMGTQLLTEALGGGMRYVQPRLAARSFATGMTRRPTNVSFVAVTEPENDIAAFEILAIGPACGSATCDFLPSDSRVSYQGPVTGRSMELAAAIARMQELGLPVSGGTYTGCIEEYVETILHDGHMVQFLILPVDGKDQKLLACDKLKGQFVDGFWADGRLRVLPDARHFGGLVQLTAREYEATSYGCPPGSKASFVSILWRGESHVR